MPTSLSPYQETIFQSRYAKWNDDHGRRETWPEAVDRYLGFFTAHLSRKHNFTVDALDLASVRKAIVDLDVMPSMRALMTAGVALQKVQMANYNCTAHPIDGIRALPEMMYILMSGSGSGFSVERRFTEKFAVVPALHESDTTIVVADSRKGWCVAYQQLLSLLYEGSIPKWDTSKVRAPGTRLKTFGGYASGPQVLEDLFAFTVTMFKNAYGRKLKPIELFSLATYVAQIVVVGGVRRSATICLFDADDLEMMRAKTGSWWKKNPHFAMANISAVFEKHPERRTFNKFWKVLRDSRAGEPGLFNRAGVWQHLTRHGRTTERDGQRIPFLVNPCSEIILRPYQACNLSGVAIRPDDTLGTLMHKVRIATIIGTWQACVTDFDYLRKSWQDNIEEERLLGVCLSGFYDHAVLSTTSAESAEWLQELRDYAIQTNRAYSARMGITPSTSVTSVKPAGNSGELYDTASGIHPRYSRFYVRRVRQSNTHPITQFLKDQGVPWEKSAQKPDHDTVFSFPCRAPDGVPVAADVKALDQLAHWLHVKENYTTHTVSCTIYVDECEWDEVAEWVFGNWDQVTGLSFLPKDNGTYMQAPYEAITEAEFNKLSAALPAVDWTALAVYEQEDTTVTGQEFTCIGGSCALT